MSMNATGSLSEIKCTEYTLLQKYHTVVYSTIPPQSNCMYIHPVYVTFYSNILLALVKSYTSLDTMPNTLTEGKWKAIHT